MHSTLCLTTQEGYRIEQQRQVATGQLDLFLASVERRALVMAESATKNREDGLDLVQDAMLSFVRHYGSKANDEWAPLFFRVLQNRILDWHRKNQVRHRWLGWLVSKDDEDDQDPLDNLPDQHCRTPDELLRLDQSGQALMVAVQNLPLRQQQAFFLRTWEGMDVATTASVMGCSEGSVKTHLSRALTSLRSQLEDHY